MTEWHSSWKKMKQRPHLLVVMPPAVESSWRKWCGMAYNVEPYAHQRQITEWLESRGGKGLVTADMGTGKTLIGLMASGSWGKEFLPLGLTRGTTKKRAEKLRQQVQAVSGDRSLVCMVNYEAVWRGELAEAITKTQWQAIILDESHRAKSPNSKTSKWLHRLAKAQPHARRILLTGTPMPQSPLDLYGQARILDDEVFGTSFARFRARYANVHPMFASKVLSYKNQEEFGEKLDSISYRVEADDVLDLPETMHERIEIEMSPAMRKVYTGIAEELTAEIEQGTITVSNALNKLLRLQQVTSGFAHLTEGGTVPIDGTPAKRLALEDRLGDLPATEPVVVFCRFRNDLAEVQAAAKSLGREYAEVSGSRKDLERWQAGDAVILGVQIQSGGLGIDCSRAAYAFYYSIGFSLGDYQQSLARLHRPGQTRCVRYYHLVCKDSVDEQVYAALQNRQNVIEAVMARLTNRTEVAA